MYKKIGSPGVDRAAGWPSYLEKLSSGQDVQKYFPFFVSHKNEQFIAILYFELKL